MEMRKARCIAEANADDLLRTMNINKDRIVEMMRQHKQETSRD